MMKKRLAAIAANNFVVEWRFTTEGRSAAQKKAMLNQLKALLTKKA